MSSFPRHFVSDKNICFSYDDDLIVSGCGVDWVVSPLSRVLTVFYILIGAPIMFMYISTTGSLLARALRFENESTLK